MGKQSLFKANFEESLNLEDDGFLQYQKRDVFSKLEKSYRKGKTTIRLHIQSVILTLIGPIAINFMFLVFSEYLHDSDPKDLTLPISRHPLLTVEVYLVCLLLWGIIILIGKIFRRAYILAYRYHFHVITFLVWTTLEFNLLVIDVSLPTLSLWGIVTILVLILLLACVMFISRIRRLKNLIYGTNISPSLSDKIAGKIAVYGMGILGIGVIIRVVLSSLSIKLSNSMVGLGLLLTWIVANIAIIAIIIYLEFPSYLQAYYKWKYSEEYREWEGKSLEEWYGKRYLKKHPELLKRDLQ
ncbi:hypothetical protein [Streptococcus mutans]|jgi:putative membrane protein|uniref:hypothetical protein n=1 Tax=Streptococcus mutans TaxID=1309 RepID=UPI00189C07F8|nr:hypothetical protein [Streptococcus mutans]MCB4947936.1 hypothetical protein [Streptococcus mutans]MCB4959068.1 hypothetical protein [Streptococcus mutans]MCB5000414.1 hypothetical protein [Streptococcus mutans]MCB5077645.1 hypothetical protein [Streptococcus mutans]MCB5126702.1 hypothetical protein [Streptococcus mutans]